MKSLTTIQSSNFSWWLNYQILTSDQKLLLNVQSSTSSSLNQVLKSNCWQWSLTLKRTNFKWRNKNWWRNKTSSRSSWMNCNPHCWSNCHRPTLLLSWTTKSLLTTWRKLKSQPMKFKNNQKSPKSHKSTSTHKEKSIVQWLQKAPCYISCVFHYASLTTCINTHWKVSLSSSSRQSKELLKRMKPESVSSSWTSDTQFINGSQEDFSKNINSSSCPWLPSD